MNNDADRTKLGTLGTGRELERTPTGTQPNPKGIPTKRTSAPTADANREGTGQGLHQIDAGAGLPGDLREIVARWEALPEALRSGIVAMVRAAGGKGGV